MPRHAAVTQAPRRAVQTGLYAFSIGVIKLVEAGTRFVDPNSTGMQLMQLVVLNIAGNLISTAMSKRSRK